jgi:hypothetical protein
MFPKVFPTFKFRVDHITHFDLLTCIVACLIDVVGMLAINQSHAFVVDNFVGSTLP